jgi:hypothetical protein
MKIPDSTDLRTICSALAHFYLPTALCDFHNNAVVFWNRTFQNTTGLSEAELAQIPLSSLILLGESYSGLVLQDHEPEQVVRFVPCVLKKPLVNELVHGGALVRSDGMMLTMLSLPLGDVAFEGFIHGRFVGREEERQRTREFLHDVLSSKILVASFIAHEVYQNLAATGADDANDLARVSRLLREVIEDVARGFEDPQDHAEPMPEVKTTSLNRLLGS